MPQKEKASLEVPKEKLARDTLHTTVCVRVGVVAVAATTGFTTVVLLLHGRLPKNSATSVCIYVALVNEYNIISILHLYICNFQSMTLTVKVIAKKIQFHAISKILDFSTMKTDKI